MNKTLMMSDIYLDFIGPDELGKTAHAEVAIEKKMLDNMGVVTK